MASQTIPVRNYQVGTNNLGPVSIAAGTSKISIALSRADWTDPAVTVHARFEISLDGGVTWSPNPSGEQNWPYGPFPVTFDAQGGIVPMPGGGTLTESSVSMALPDTANANRQVRGIATVAGGILRTAVTITTI